MSTGGPMGGGVITGRDGVGNPIVTYYASGPTAPAGGWLNVWDYWQDTDQWPVLDHALMFNRAIAAGASLYPNGFAVYAPVYTYITNSSIVIPAGNIVLCGDGWGTVIQPASGATFDAIRTPIPSVQGTPGFILNGLGIRDLAIDCSQMAGTVAGQGNAIHWYGVRYSEIRRVYINKAPNWAILLEGDGTNFSYWNEITGCFTNQCAGHVRTTSSEANRIRGNTFNLTQNSALAAPQPAFGTQSTAAYVLYLNSGYANVMGNVIKNSAPNLNPALFVDNSGPCLIVGNKFDTCQTQAIQTGAGGHSIVGNEIDSANQAAQAGTAAIQLGSSGNSVIGNVFSTQGTGGGAAKWNYCVEEGGTRQNNVIVGNQLQIGTSDYLGLNATSTGDRVLGNSGFNPRGHSVSQPAVPASGTAQQNQSGVDCTVYVTGGTVTQIAVNAVNTNMTSGAIRVPSGQTITLTYSAAPTWQWFGD